MIWVLVLKYWKQIFAASAILGILGLGAWRFYTLGKEVERQRGLLAQYEASRQQMLVEVQARDFKIKTLQEQALANTAQLQQALVALSQANRTLDILAAQRQQIQTTVAALPDVALPNDVRASAGLPLGTSPTFEAAELRVIDLQLRDVPILKAEKLTLGQKVDALAAQSSALQGRVDNLSQQLVIERDYSKRIYNQYVTLYNTAQPKRGFWGHVCGIFTFYQKCKPKHLELVAP